MRLFRTMLCGFNQIGCFLANHDGGRVRSSRDQSWHDGGIDDTQSLQPHVLVVRGLQPPLGQFLQVPTE